MREIFAEQFLPEATISEIVKQNKLQVVSVIVCYKTGVWTDFRQGQGQDREQIQILVLLLVYNGGRSHDLEVM